MQDATALARQIIDANPYMTLGTADESGRPWVSPVYYACAAYSEFFWVSSPEALHSRNLAIRPRVSMVVFDSHAAVGSAQAVYASAVAEELDGAELDRGVAVFSRRSVIHGAQPWSSRDVSPPAPHRLYRASVSEVSVLDAARTRDERIPVTLAP